MSQSFVSLNFLPKGKYRIDLVEGVTKTNFFSLCYGALTTIGLLTFISYATTYVLIENLEYQRESIGTIVGDLQVVAEIALLMVFLPVGLIADKIGRRQVYSFGMAAMGLSYFLYPLATGIGELTVYRVIYAIGMGAATGMLGTVNADYPQDRTRGKMLAVTGILNATGVILVSLVFARLPENFAQMGYDQITAGKYAMWVVAGMCLTTAIVVAFGLQKGTPTEEQKKIPYLTQVKSGWQESRNPRILLAYAAAFVARSDLVILGTFLVLWGVAAGTDMGMTTSEATKAARLIFVTASTSALIASPIIGYLIDKVDRIIAVSVCMALADHGLGKDETAEILKIAKEIKVDFNVHNATDEIDKKFSGDIDMAQDFYLGNITKDDFKFRVKDFVKRVALSDGELKDKEVRFLVRMKQAWGYQYFD